VNAQDLRSIVDDIRTYLVLSIATIFAGFIELRWGVDAERKPLEAVASPLTFVK
jgi:hypothetical protein